MIIWARISGLPYAWGSCSASEAWGSTLTLGGETYTWLDTLDASKISGPEEKIEPWAGICLPGSVTLRAVADTAWLGLLNRSIYRGAVAQLTARLTYNATVCAVDDETPFSVPGYVYAGSETIYVGSAPALQLDDLVRARFGSHAGPHEVGTYISDHPLTLAGRYVWLYVCEDYESPGDGLRATCVLESVQLSPDGLTVEMQCGDLTRAIDRRVAEAIPKARLGKGSLIQVDQWSEAWSLNSVLGDVYGGTLPAGSELRTARQISGQISDVLMPYGIAVTLSEVYYADESGARWHLEFRSASVPFVLVIPPRGLWLELGWTTAAETVDNRFDGSTGVWAASSTADRVRPQLRLPAGQGHRIVWCDDSSSLVTGWDPTDADGNVLEQVFKVGDEYVLGSVVTCSVDEANPRTFRGISPTQRGLYGTETAEETYVEEGSDPPEVAQLVSLYRCEWPRIVAYLLCGGRNDGGEFSGLGSSARRWCGAAIPEGLVDTAGLEELALDAEGSVKLSVVLEDGTSVREVLEPILVQMGYYLHTSAGVLTVDRIRTPLATDAGSATTLDHDDIASVQGIRWDVADDNIINRVVGSNIARTESKITIVHVPSIETFGSTEPLEVDLSQWHSVQAAELQLQTVAETMFARWSSPFVVVELSIASEAGWDLQLGDAVAITHTVLPSVSAVTRGVTALPGVVYGRAPSYTGAEERGRLTVLVAAIDGTQCTEWAPSAWGTVLTAFGRVCVVTVDDDYYGGSSVAEFQAGDEVRVYERGNETTAIACTVTAVGVAAITVDDTLAALTAPVVIEFVAYASATARQQTYAYVADDSARPYTIDGTDTPYHFE